MLLLAPLRGVTIRTFRDVFAAPIAEAGFTEAITPFIPALPGLNPLTDRELCVNSRRDDDANSQALKITPQLIGKDPTALREALLRLRDGGYDTVDLNCGCPFPMVRNKGRGAGLLKHPDTLDRMLDVGCATLGDGKFSAKTRLGVDSPDELEALMPIFNRYPLRFLTVHGRIARQMYDGACDMKRVTAIAACAKMPVVANGDLNVPTTKSNEPIMVGRSFIRSLGLRDDIGDLLRRYCDVSRAELCGERPVLGRLKELIAYFKELPTWSRRWQIIKITRTIDELKSCLPRS